MNKINKYLLFVVMIIFIIALISFFSKETNFSIPEQKDNKQYVDVNKNNELLRVELNEYLTGVIAGEMPASFEEEALKAQAIASRTYLIYHQQSSEVIDSTIADQVYLTEKEMKEKWQDNYDYYYNKIYQSVLDTKDQIITYQGEPIKAYYYSMSNGYTESSLNVFNEQTDYLNIVESSWDKDNEETIYISKEEFCQKLKINCDTINISTINKDKSQRISNITINNKKITGIEVRKSLNLRSTDFEITIEDDSIKITTRGYGHGVGMSQYGANYMAKEGYTYKEILKHYYQNTEITKL